MHGAGRLSHAAHHAAPFGFAVVCSANRPRLAKRSRIWQDGGQWQHA
jgi:hypothetical protein